MTVAIRVTLSQTPQILLQAEQAVLCVFFTMQPYIQNSGIPRLFDTAPTHTRKLQDKALIKSNR